MVPEPKPLEQLIAIEYSEPMLPPEEYEIAAQEANYHIQLAMENVVAESGQACLSGPVVRVFRGAAELLGTRMTLKVNYFQPQDQINAPPDGVMCLPIESLKPGRVLEALVKTEASRLEIPLGLCTVLDSPTSTPQLAIDFKPVRGSNRVSLSILAAVAVAIGVVSIFLLLR